MNNPPLSTVVIIGGGFSGIMVAANLIQQSTEPLHVFIVEKTEHLSKGVAYSTPAPYHLLNVPGANMGAFADNPNHFMEWLQATESTWRNYDREFQSLPIEPTRYYPRKLYGFYLENVFKETQKQAQEKGIILTIIADEAIDVDITHNRTAIVKLKNGALPPAHQVVIATGNMPVKSFSFAQSMFLCEDRYINNIWSGSEKNLFLKPDLSFFPSSTHIAIVGTGLTMVDALLSLRHKGYQGKITAISRHGKLPQAHDTFAPYHAFIDLSNLPDSSYDLFLLLRKEIKKALEAGYNWRAVLQELRPITNTLWAHLPRRERYIITKKLMSYWNIHRHRIPRDILTLLEQEIKNRTLSIIPGTIYYIGGKKEGPLMVSYRKTGEDFIEHFAADYVLNCSGPETDIAKSGNAFLLRLRDKGIIHVGTLRMGIELTPNDRVKGRAPDIFHAVGALLMGEKLESTAVPDIRTQAQEAALRILSGYGNEDYSHYYDYFI